MIDDTEIYRLKRTYSAISLVYCEVYHRTVLFNLGTITGRRMVEYLKWFLTEVFYTDLEIFLRTAENEGWITDSDKITAMTDLFVIRHDINLKYTFLSSVRKMIRMIDVNDPKTDYDSISNRIQQAIDETDMQLLLK